MGPTASGKSSLAMELARKFDGEIINCDSVQLYQGFNIGAAKPSLKRDAEKSLIIFWMYLVTVKIVMQESLLTLLKRLLKRLVTVENFLLLLVEQGFILGLCGRKTFMICLSRRL